MRLGPFIKGEVENRSKDENHVCGVLVQFNPERREDVRALLQALPGVEVHHTTCEGKMVVTVEDTEDATAGEILHKLPLIKGVIATSLVYHHHDTGETEEFAS